MNASPEWYEHWRSSILVLLILFVLATFVYQRLTDRKRSGLTPQEELVSGLPFYTNPSFWRLLGFLIVIFSAKAFLPIISLDTLFPNLIADAIALFVLLGFGARAAHDKWLSDDKLARQKRVVEAQRKN
jgi:uncharacterized membrane protein YhaH (DUF805 family)